MSTEMAQCPSQFGVLSQQLNKLICFFGTEAIVRFSYTVLIMKLGVGQLEIRILSTVFLSLNLASFGVWGRGMSAVARLVILVQLLKSVTLSNHLCLQHGAGNAEHNSIFAVWFVIAETSQHLVCFCTSGNAVKRFRAVS